MTTETTDTPKNSADVSTPGRIWRNTYTNQQLIETAERHDDLVIMKSMSGVMVSISIEALRGDKWRSVGKIHAAMVNPKAVKSSGLGKPTVTQSIAAQRNDQGQIELPCSCGNRLIVPSFHSGSMIDCPECKLTIHYTVSNKSNRTDSNNISHGFHIPEWGTAYAGLCGYIPFFARGGAIPIGIGVFGFIFCLSISSNQSISTATRVLICSATLCTCWFTLFALHQLMYGNLYLR